MLNRKKSAKKQDSTTRTSMHRQAWEKTNWRTNSVSVAEQCSTFVAVASSSSSSSPFLVNFKPLIRAASNTEWMTNEWRRKNAAQNVLHLLMSEMCVPGLPLSLSSLCRCCCYQFFFLAALHTCPVWYARRSANACCHRCRRRPCTNSVCARMCQLTCPVISYDFCFRFILKLRHLLQLCSSIFGSRLEFGVHIFEIPRNGYSCTNILCVWIWDSKWMLPSFIARVYSDDLLSTIPFTLNSSPTGVTIGQHISMAGKNRKQPFPK